MSLNSQVRPFGITTIKLPFTKKQVIRCFFCNGSKCKRCGELAYQHMIEPALEKCHSSWVTSNIIAMQRPNDKQLDNGLMQQFIDNNIMAIFNLTEAGEHPNCGCGIIEDSGFSYTPEKLMSKGIKYFNYSWPDMTAPSINMMKDIVNVAINEIKMGNKIAVHCHAGFGRTGIAIACILIVHDRLSSAEAIAFVRKNRKGSIQTRVQEKFICEFEDSYNKTIQVYPTILQKDISDENNLYSSKINIINKNIKECILELDNRLHSVKLVDTNMILFEKKTISKSLQDQLYVLPMFMNKYIVDLNELRWIHKVVYEIVKNFNVFLTNSNNIKDNSDYLIFYSTFIGYIKNFDNTSLIHLSTFNNSVLYDPLEKEFRIISEEEEYHILEIKHDINVNKWQKFEEISNENISNRNDLFINIQLLIDFLDCRSDEIFDNQLNPHLLVCSEGIDFKEDNQQENISESENEINLDNKIERKELTFDLKLCVTNSDENVFTYVTEILETQLNRNKILMLNKILSIFMNINDQMDNNTTINLEKSKIKLFYNVALFRLIIALNQSQNILTNMISGRCLSPWLSKILFNKPFLMSTSIANIKNYIILSYQEEFKTEFVKEFEMSLIYIISNYKLINLLIEKKWSLKSQINQTPLSPIRRMRWGNV